MSKPTVFIGSSSEGLEFARAVQSDLASVALGTVWNQGTFAPNESGLGALLKACSEYDFAVFIATGEDVSVIRGVEAKAPRDNVLFELGLFYGAIGRERTFLFVDSSARPRLPSDLAGITVNFFDGDVDDGQQRPSVGPPCGLVRAKISQLGRRHTSAVQVQIPGCPIIIVKGKIEHFDRPGTALLIPVNNYFDTTSDSRIVEPRSALGATLAKRERDGTLSALNKSLDEELAAVELPKLKARIKRKPGRTRAYQAGCCVRVPGEPSDIILGATSLLKKRGNQFFAVPFKQSFNNVLLKLWRNLSEVRVRGELAMPILGAGFLGLPKEMVLTKLLCTLRQVEVEFGRNICDQLTIVVYPTDWEGGAWVHNVANAVALLTTYDI